MDSLMTKIKIEVKVVHFTAFPGKNELNGLSTLNLKIGSISCTIAE